MYLPSMSASPEPNAIPAPDADALAHSERLRRGLQEQIHAAGGAIPFSRFMELSLYAPGWATTARARQSSARAATS
jgi:hypothetical protein